MGWRGAFRYFAGWVCWRDKRRRRYIEATGAAARYVQDRRPSMSAARGFDAIGARV